MSTAVSISKSKLVLTPVKSLKKKKPVSQLSKKNLIRNADYNGYISRPTVKRIGQMVENMVFALDKFKMENKYTRGAAAIQPTFVTLTISYEQIQSDKYIKRNMLMRFIEVLKKEKGIQNYIWRAEPQKNGNIHFHILIDRFVNWQYIKQEWNKIQGKHDYLDAFQQRHGHRNPNSTDIHGLRNVNNIAAYICKYMVKDKPLRKIEGRIWGCSSNFHRVKNPRISVTPEITEVIEAMVRESKVYKKVAEYYTVYRYKKNEILTAGKNCIYEIYSSFVSSFIKLTISQNGT